MSLLLILLLATFLPAPNAVSDEIPKPEEGHEVGNAGDIFAIEFKLTARDLVQRLRYLPEGDRKEINLDQLAGAISSTKVSSEERVYLNNYEVNAKNLPLESRIVINRSWWRAIRIPSETQNRVRLVLHEYLPLVGLPDEGARVSERLVALLDVKNFDPNRWWNPLNPANHVTISLDSAPAGCALSSVDPNTSISEEDFVVETEGTCGEFYRKVSLHKSSFNAPPSTGYRGTVHRYDITIVGPHAVMIGSARYTPRIAECLAVDDGTCALGGTISPGDGSVNLQFWYLRDKQK